MDLLLYMILQVHYGTEITAFSHQCTRIGATCSTTNHCFFSPCTAALTSDEFIRASFVLLFSSLFPCVSSTQCHTCYYKPEGIVIHIGLTIY